MIQMMVYDDLNRTAKNTRCRHFHSQNSVLPYLLSSPYSPLALSDMPPPKRARGLTSLHLDEYPYCAAFEDLLLASQGRPMGLHVLVPSTSIPNLRAANRVAFGDVDKEVRKAKVGVDWLNTLHAR